MVHEIDKSAVVTAVNEAYTQYAKTTEGQNASYIPYLKNIPPSLFGISVCMADGERIEVGDTGYRFGIESVSKVPTAILAMKQHGTQTVMKKIGADATGLPFNSIIAILLENDHPSTPLVNAGAITACSMIAPTGNSDAKWLAIKGFVESLCGSAVEVIDELYRSESATNFNNRSIAWLLKNYGRIYDDPDLSLDIYTHQCSIGITASQLAVMAATIAADGRNPVTHDEVFAAEIAPRIVSLMSTVGFYERTGDWMFQTGIPAKSGVGGTAAIELKLYSGLYMDFYLDLEDMVSQWVYVRLDGLYLGNYRMMLSIGDAPSDGYNTAGRHKYYANSNLDDPKISALNVFAGEKTTLDASDILEVDENSYRTLLTGAANIKSALGRLVRFKNVKVRYAGVKD